MDTSKWTILIVEDEKSLQKAYSDAFLRNGFLVQQSGEGMDAIVQAIEKQPDVILLDLMMPYVDGFEVIDAIRTNSDMNIPIVVLSNRDDSESQKRSFKLGANEYLRKYEYRIPQKLVKKVSSFLNKTPEYKREKYARNN